jgi:ribonuclease P protein component
MERWLSLTVLNNPSSETPRVYISVPKRAVKLAVKRNRIKRVLREAVRLDPFFAKNRIYRLRVSEMPIQIDLKEAQKALSTLHD